MAGGYLPTNKQERASEAFIECFGRIERKNSNKKVQKNEISQLKKLRK